MALETATYIDELNTSNPTSGDNASQGDDHLRLLKSVLQNTFSGISGEVTVTHTELNYLAGVTSAIQTQLDQAKLTDSSTSNATGTAVEFTSIPSWVKQIFVTFRGVSTDGSAVPLILLGDSGGSEASGYSGTVWSLGGGSGSSLSGAFSLISAFAAATSFDATVILTRHDSASNAWNAFSIASLSTGNIHVMTGSKALSSTLTLVRVSTAGATDNFDAGTISIHYH